MHPAASSRVFFVVGLITAVLLLAQPVTVFADDSAASIAAGGLIPRRETRIVMAKELLQISEKKVVVDYDFRNDTDEDITTEVAFPVPPYTDNVDAPEVSLESFSNFHLYISGKAARFNVEAKAVLKGRDITGILAADRIDVASFGHYQQRQNGEAYIGDFIRLPMAEQKHLRALGLFAQEGHPQQGNWTVHLQYHWTQTFPAHSTLHIRHEYTPVLGYTQLNGYDVDAMLSKNFSTSIAPAEAEQLKQDKSLLTKFCADRPFLDALSSNAAQQRSNAKNDEDRMVAGVFYPRWADFILTTANNWQRPIEDFTLIIERPATKEAEETLVTLCSPGPVKKLDTDHFQVHLTNFVPKAELHIGFFGLPVAKAAKPRQKK